MRTRKLPIAALVGALIFAFTAPTAATADDVSVNIVNNGSFEQFTGSVPDAWSRWNAAGTGTISRVAGVAGSSALEVTTNTTSSRLALLQDVQVTAGLYRLDFRYQLSNMSGAGTAGIRVNVSGSASSPFIGSNTDTAGWQDMTGWVSVPASSTSARLHVFNDAVRGTMKIDDVRLTRMAEQTKVATATITASGDIGLDWEASDAQGILAYDIYRAEGTVVEKAVKVRSVPASLTEATDQDWLPGASYSYLVAARDAAGKELFRTAPVRIEAPARSNILSSSLAALELDGEVHLSWAASRELGGPFTLHGSSSSLVDGDLTGASLLASDIGAVAALDLATSLGHFALVADGKVVATASLGGLAHPRIMLNEDVLAKIKRLIAKPGTPQQMFETIRARVDKGLASSTTSADRFAREVAFLYQVSGEQKYADLAFEAFESAAKKTPFGAKQALDTANPTSQLALAYDWAYNGWSGQQRTYAQEYFERTSVFLELANHPNMVWEDKASNWVGVTRGAELAQHLAVRGDGDYGLRDARIARLLDQLVRHAEQGYAASGWYQEGLDYLDYDNMIATTGVLGSFDVGIDAIRDAWYKPETASLLLHSDSLRAGAGSSLQWGVGTAGHPAWPLYLDRMRNSSELSRGAAMFERTQGHLAAQSWYSPAYALYAFVYWPEGEAPDLHSDEVLPALLDDEAGVAMFRNRVQDVDDVLLGLNNGNRAHLGWKGFDTFGLSLIGGDTMWASQPGKDQKIASKYSRVLVDGIAEQVVGKGKTISSSAFPAQGGGFVHFDGSENLGVQSATREAVVDMTTRSAADTIFAISDSFTDSKSHQWTWQLAPQAGVTAEIGELVNGTRQVTLHHNDAWMRLWVLDAEGADVTFSQGVLRVVRDGTTANFDIVVALGTSTELPVATTAGTVVSIDGFTIDMDTMAQFTPASAVAQWDGKASYRAGDTVSVAGSVYEAARPTSGDLPAAKVRGPWQEMVQAGDTIFWTPTRIFTSGDTVRHEGAVYTANRKNRDTEPGNSPGNAWSAGTP